MTDQKTYQDGIHHERMRRKQGLSGRKITCFSSVVNEASKTKEEN